MRPAQAVDDIAVLRTQRDRAAQHLEGFVEVHVLVDPRIAEIIQNQRLFWIKLQRLLEIGFRRRPVLRALVGDPAIVIERPERLLRPLGKRERLRIGVDRAGEILARAQEIAERRLRFRVVGMLLDEIGEDFRRFVLLVHRLEQKADLDVGVHAQR